MFGGSFQGFCTLKNSNSEPNQKMFLIVLPRKYTQNNSGEEVHPVYVAEIKIAMPRLCNTSFNSELDSVRLRTNISLDLTTKEKWFDLPRAQDVDFRKVKEQVFIESFGKHVYDEMNGNAIDQSPESKKNNDSIH